MTKCDARSYNGIPATIEEFKAFVNDLAQKKMETLGDKNPCKEISADQYDEPTTPNACKKVAHETRFYAAKYARRYIREAAARALDPFFKGQMNGRDELLIQVVQEKHYNWDVSNQVPLTAYGAPRFTTALSTWWSSATDFLGFGSASDFWESTKNGTNLQCIGKDNICTTIEDKANQFEDTFTLQKISSEEDGSLRHFALLTPYHVLYNNKADPDECKHDFRLFMTSVDAWSAQLTNKMVGLGVIAPPAEEEDEIEDQSVELPATTTNTTVAEKPKVPAKMRKKEKTLLDQALGSARVCAAELQKCASETKTEVAKLTGTVTGLQKSVATAKAEAQRVEERARVAENDKAALEAALKIAQAELDALKKAKPPAAVAKDAPPQAAKPAEPAKPAPKLAEPEKKKPAPAAPSKPKKPAAPRATPKNDGGILMI